MTPIPPRARPGSAASGAESGAALSGKGRPYRTLSAHGFEVLVGRGDEENDVLTFEVADLEDFWLHVAGGVPGSHVVVRNPEKLAALPSPVAEAAATLAVRYSKARARDRVEVHLCRVADVRKPKGTPAGEVVLRRWTRVPVRRAGRPGPS